MSDLSKRHPGRPKKETWDACKVEGCECTTVRGAFGMCRTHYAQVRRGMRAEDGTLLRSPLRVRSYGAEARCTVPGCSNRPKVQGLCAYHHSAGIYWGTCKPVQQRHTTSYEVTAACIVEGCDKRPVSHGMCSKHSQQRSAGILDANGNQLRPLGKSGRKRQRESWVNSTRDGYVVRVAPEGHPRARADGTILEHRFIMEQNLGRYLEDWEIVHHKDGNRSNNALENLEIFDGRAGSGPRHHPGHAFDPRAATQALLQREDIPEELRLHLSQYRDQCTS